MASMTTMMGDISRIVNFIRIVKKTVDLYNNSFLSAFKEKTLWAQIGKQVNLTGPECKNLWRKLRKDYKEFKDQAAKGECSNIHVPVYISEMQFIEQYILTVFDNTIELDDYDEDVQHLFVEAKMKEPPSPRPTSPQQDVKQSPGHQPSTSQITVDDFLECVINSPENPKKKKLSNNEPSQLENSDIGSKCATSVDEPQVTPVIAREGSTSGSLINRKDFLLCLLQDLNSMTDKQFRTFRKRIFELIDDVTNIKE